MESTSTRLNQQQPGLLLSLTGLRLSFENRYHQQLILTKGFGRVVCRAEEKEGNLGSWLQQSEVIFIIISPLSTSSSSLSSSSTSKKIIFFITISNLVVFTAVTITIRLNSTPHSGMFYYFDQHRLLTCLQPKVATGQDSRY